MVLGSAALVTGRGAFSLGAGVEADCGENKPEEGFGFGRGEIVVSGVVADLNGTGPPSGGDEKG